MYGRPSKRFRRIKPVARVGAIDINVRYDIQQFQLNRQKATDECFDVLEGEVLFKTPDGDFYRDNSLHVLSCFEGQYNAQERPKDFSVAGVAVTGFSPRTDVYEQGFVLQVSGLTTIYNNSGKTINAGEEVFVMAPNGNAVQDQNPNGVPRTKKLLKLFAPAANGEVPANAKFLGTCVKGGPKKGTIDIVLHKAPKNAFQPAGDGDGDAERGAEREDEIGIGGGFRPAAAAAPKRVKSKKAKAAK